MTSRLALLSVSACIFVLAIGCDKPESKSAGTHHASESVAVNEKAHSPIGSLKSPRAFAPGPELATSSPTNVDYVVAWNRFTTVGDYRRYGKTNVAWDGPAVAAMEAYCAQRNVNSDSEQARIQSQIAEEVKKAMAAGCDDPLIKYLHARFALTREDGITYARLGDAYEAALHALQKSEYSPVRKTYAALRGFEAIRNDLPEHVKTNKYPARATAMLRATVHHFTEACLDPKMPPREGEDLSRQIWNIAGKSELGRYDLEGLLVPTLEKGWTSNAFAFWICGQLSIEKAWKARGGGFADTVNTKGWDGFEDNLRMAELILRKGWDRDPVMAEIPIAMITVCMGRGHPREEMEKWFERAMALNPNSYEAVSKKSFYLEPRWHGSEKETLEFGRECVANKKWGGTVPLILADLHSSLQRYYKTDEHVYYHRPEVWQDIRASYERFFEANPNDGGYRHNYALDAYRCGQPQIFLDQTAKFGSWTNHAWFGGEKKFNEMVQQALAAQGK